MPHSDLSGTAEPPSPRDGPRVPADPASDGAVTRLTVTARAESNMPVLVVAGLLAAATASVLCAAFSDLLGGGMELIGIDLAAVTALGPGGLEALLACRAEASATGTAVILLRPSRRLRRSLEVHGAQFLVQP